MRYALAVLLTVFTSCFATNSGFAQNVVLYDFTASWCGPCQQMSPIVHKLKREGLPIQAVDVDKYPQLKARYNVSSIPAFVLVVDGKEVNRIVGRSTETQLRQMLASVSRKPQNAAQTATPRVQPNRRGSATASSTAFNGNPLQARLGQPAPFPQDNQLDRMASVRQPSPVADRFSTPGMPNTASAGTNSRSLQQPEMNSVRAAVLDRPVHSQPLSNNGQNNPADSDGTVIRAQFSDETQTATASAQVNPQAANVRLRIETNNSVDHGSGTIIESRPGLTYILTCGHICRDVTAAAKIYVDVFNGEKYESFLGKVHDFDAEAEVGIISISTDRALPIAQLGRIEQPVRVGDSVISVGCNGGELPTVETIQVKALNQFKGPDNMSCTGFPVPGRSGGGLFNERGEIVGVCFANDPKEQQGLYAPLSVVSQLLERGGLGHLVRRESPPPAAADVQFAVNNQAQQRAPEMPADLTTPAGSSPQQPQAEPVNQPTSSPTPQQIAQALQTLQAAQGSKLTILIENPHQPGHTQVVIIPAATQRFIADLTGQLDGSSTVAAQRMLSNGQHSQVSTRRQSTVRDSLVPCKSAPSQRTLPPVSGDVRFVGNTDRSVTNPTNYSVSAPAVPASAASANSVAPPVWAR